ncbi:MAG: nucleotidyltransferase domain-containing protein [Candidatus Eremiobacterota bacterium]
MRTGLSMSNSEILAIKELKKVLYSSFNIIDMKIFGSKSRGEGNSDSDIDLMIEIDISTADIISQIYDITFDINLAYDTSISPVIFSKLELEEGPMSESPLYKVIQKEGVPI